MNEDHLDPDIHLWPVWCSECEELQAEVERQKERYHQVRHENKELQAEGKRYRDALEKIADNTSVVGWSGAAYVAAQALEPEHDS